MTTLFCYYVCLLCNHFGRNCTILKIMSLIEISLKQLESWLASYCTPLHPMLLALSCHWILRRWSHSSLCFALCARITVYSLASFNMLLYSLHWYSDVVFSFMACLEGVPVAKRDISSSDPNYFFMRYPPVKWICLVEIILPMALKVLFYGL